MDLTAKIFDYDTSAVSREQFEQHIKLYNGYIDKINQITGELKKTPDRTNANAVYSKYRGLKKGETFALDGVILHEAYFQNMQKQKSAPGKRTTDIFLKYFDGFEGWKNDFTACCKAARGWCILVYEQRSNSFRHILLDSHDDGMVCMAYPILVMDMYEHAYFLDYATNKDEYINNFILSINWDVVERRVTMLE